jgi:hypothetical protein
MYMTSNKRILLIATMTVMILAFVAVVPIHKLLVPGAAASSSGGPQKRMISAATAGSPASAAVYDDGSLLIGAHSLAGLTAQSWRWAYSIPVGVDPGSDTTGVNCGINQRGDVWFLAATVVGDSSVTCAVPAGKMLVSAVYASLDDYPCPPEFNFQPPPDQSLEKFLLQDDAQYVDGVTATGQLDGKPLRVKRIKSRLFSFTAAASHSVSDPCVTGSPQLGVSDGYFVFIEPLSVGPHLLQLSWSGPSGAGSHTVHLRIH